MPWDINQINREFMSNLPQPGEAFQAGQDESFKRRVLEAQVATQQQQAALAQQRAKQKQIDVQAFIAKPSAQGAAALQAAYPEDMAAFKESWATRDADTQKNDLREMSAIHGYLKSGMPDRAKVLVQQRIDADKAAGQNTTEDEQFLAAINEDPNKASGLMALMLAPIVGPEKFDSVYKNVGDSDRADAKLPGEVALTEAQAGKAAVEAEMAPAVIESSLKSEAATREKQAADIAQGFERLKIDTERLNLDRERITADTIIRTNEIQQKYGQLPPPAQKIVNDAVLSAGVNYGLANRAKDLAEQFQAVPVSGGWAASFAEKFRGAFGSQDALTALRNSYNQLVNSQAVKNLPPGPASDKDIQLAKQGFPPPNAGKAHIVSFLTGMEKMQRLAGEADDRRAEWAGANGGLGAAKQPIVVDGWRVEPGTTFNQFNQSVGKLSKGPPAGITALEQQVKR